MDRRSTTRWWVAVCALVAMLGISGVGCAETGPGSPAGEPDVVSSTSRDQSDTADSDHPDVLAAELQREGGGSWTLTVTLSSEYDSPGRYADGWRVVDPDGELLGTHELSHDHADEQPFTRTQTGLEIPDGVSRVTVEGHDTANGYGGGALSVDVPKG